MAQAKDGSTYGADVRYGSPTSRELTSAGGLFDVFVGDRSMPQNPTTSPNAKPQVNFLYSFLAIFILLIIAKVASEHSRSDMKGNLSLMGIGVWNFLLVGVTSVLFILTAKAIGNKWYVKGFTETINAV